MTFAIARGVARDMLEAAWEAAPLEACGLLAGAGGRASKCYVLANADESAEHYSMQPAEQFAAVKDMRARGLALVAIWHSHPASHARMSAEDMRLAYTPDVAYVILSLAEPGGRTIRAFDVCDGVAQEVPVKIEDEKDATI